MDEGENEVKKYDHKGGTKHGVARRRYHDGWANLAAAIIASGRRANDTRFLDSDWCEFLRDLCACDDEIYCKSLNIDPRSYYEH